MDTLTELLLAAGEGDRGAFDAFAHCVRADLRRYASAMVGGDEADDITQDVLMRAWLAAPAYRGDAPARSWVLAIARRACADAIRRVDRRRRLGRRLERSPQPASFVTDGTEGRALLDAVRSLDPDQRAAFTLTQIVGYSYDETALICSVPIGTVRSRVARARARLAEMLLDHETGDPQRNSSTG